MCQISHQLILELIKLQEREAKVRSNKDKASDEIMTKLEQLQAWMEHLFNGYSAIMCQIYVPATHAGI